jgi:putative alpha-1,2-mannosidase
MGAWNVLVSIGLFSATGACESPARYQLTAPLFDRVTIKLPAGRTLTITTSGLTPAATNYTDSITFDGKPLTSLELTHADLFGGGELHVTLSPQPAGLSAAAAS